MPYVVNEAYIKCRCMDCVEVCPVDWFYEGENILVIHPDERIDSNTRRRRLFPTAPRRPRTGWRIIAPMRANGRTTSATRLRRPRCRSLEGYAE